LKEEALDCTMWRNRFGGGFGPVVRQNTEWIDWFEALSGNKIVVYQINTIYREFYKVPKRNIQELCRKSYQYLFNKQEVRFFMYDFHWDNE
jgi:hypothetical protein